jgi:hypothetical protein
MNEVAINWLVKKNEDRRAHCIFFMGLISATQAEAEKLGFAELSEKLMHLVIEARYTVLDEMLDIANPSSLLSMSIRKKSRNCLGG